MLKIISIVTVLTLSACHASDTRVNYMKEQGFYKPVSNPVYVQPQEGYIIQRTGNPVKLHDFYVKDNDEVGFLIDQHNSNQAIENIIGWEVK